MPEGSISKYLVSNNIGPEEVVQSVKKLLTHKEEQENAKNLEPGDAKKFVELLDGVSLPPWKHSIPLNWTQLLMWNRIKGRERSPCARYLARVCGWHSILPDSAQISGHQCTSEYSGGTFSIVWIGIHNGQKVAIKALRFYTSYDEKKKRDLTRVSYPPGHNSVPDVALTSILTLCRHFARRLSFGST